MSIVKLTAMLRLANKAFAINKVLQNYGKMSKEITLSVSRTLFSKRLGKADLKTIMNPLMLIAQVNHK